MSQFYTKAQIDAQGAHMAAAISNKIRVEMAKIPQPTPPKFLGTYASVEAIPEYSGSFNPDPGSYVYVDGGAEQPTELYIWDEDSISFVKSNINPEVVANPPIEEAENIDSFTAAFDTALADNPEAV